jgi:predicted nuclease of restriction endonuclease-like (RecB) superfamily
LAQSNNESNQVAKRPGLPNTYAAFLQELKQRIRELQLRASVSVNRELVLLYWRIGRDILLRQEREHWGTKVIDRLAVDLKKAFPEMNRFSPRNLKYMRAFAEAWPEEEFVQQAVAQIPWGHNVRILDYVKERRDREWYVRATLEHGWSRDVLVHQIERGLHQRSGTAVTNFDRTLPPPQSDLAQQITKDPYSFDFLMIAEDAHERELEQGLLAHLRDFLLELGIGFAFVASQYRLDVGGRDFFVDLLFYHLKLRCFVVIDLKAKTFEPEFVGKMNFYLAAVDDLLRHPDDKPSIGLIICKTKDQIVAEYALRNTTTPIGISEYRLAESLPADLKGSLPSIEELEDELGKHDGPNEHTQ